MTTIRHLVYQPAEDRVTFFVVGLNHKTAPVELRELLAVCPSNLASRAAELKLRDDLDEIVVLSTCNRVEIYAVARRSERITHSLLGSLCPEPYNLHSCAYAYDDIKAVRHLFRVTAGVDSMVLGETEISGQVKQAYETARAAKLTGRMLNRVFQSAFQGGEGNPNQHRHWPRGDVHRGCRS